MELWETCLGALQHLTARCPTRIRAHHEHVLEAAQRFLTYDPNYSYGDEDEDNEGNRNVKVS